MKRSGVKIVKASAARPSEDVSFWLAKSPQDRIAAVEFLRSQTYETPPRLQRVFRVFQRQGR
jgi:hypothetical protein